MKLWTVFLAISLMVFSALTFAQTGNATLAGTVHDSTGAVVPNASVTVRNTGTGVARTVPTNQTGAYYVPNLIPGEYSVGVHAKGFQERSITGVRLDIDQQARVDADLKVGAVGQEVTVTSAPSLLQTEDSSVGTVVSSQHVEDLPLNGRQFTQLLQLSPGTLPATYDYLFKNADAATAGHERNGMPAFDVNGGGGAFVTFRLDGVDNSESEFGGANIPVSVDAIGEVKIQTANFSAEYGRGPSQVDVTMRAGSNKLHGTLFEFLRNDALDATQWQLTGPHVKSLLKRNQFGGSVGGPIRKDKLFFFFNYDGTREILSSPQSTAVPTDAMRNGIFPSGVIVFDPATQKPFPNNTIPSSRFDPIAVKMLAVIPKSNQPGLARTNTAGFDLAPTLNYFFNPQRRRTIDQYNVRVDYTMSEKNTFFARYTQSSNDILGDGPLATNLGSIIGTEKDSLGGRNTSATWNHSFNARMINEVRVGVSTDPQLYDTVDKTDYIHQFGVQNFLSPEAPLGLPTIQVTSSGGTTTVSGGNTRPFHVSETNVQVVDNMTMVFGTHTLRVGGDVYRGYRTPFNTARSRGQFRFSGVQTRDRSRPTVATTFCPGGTVATACTAGDGQADFLLGDLSFFEAGSPEPDVTRHVTSWDGFIQDTWRIKRNLTLNLGLRYEYLTRLTSDPAAYGLPIIVNGEFSGKVAVANDSKGVITSLALPSALAAFPGVAVTCRSVGLPDSCVTSLKKKFQPRVGFAWQLNPKTVFRGGGGTFYGHVLGDYETEEGTATFPILLDKTTQTFSTPPAGSAPPPLLLSNPLGGLNVPAPSLTSNQSMRKDPSTYQWNVTLEREVMKNTQLSVAYVATLGRNLETFQSACCNFNRPQPWGMVLAPGQKQAVPIPAFSGVYFYAYQDTSNYQSLQVKLDRRFSGGLALVVSYTHAKSIGVVNDFSDPRYPTKGSLYNDVPNNLVISPVWSLPFGVGHRFLNHKGFVDQVLGGWKMSGILSYRSGFPFTPTLSGTNLIGYTTINELPDRTCSGKISNPTVFNWFDKTCFSVPVEPTTPGALLHEGNSGMNILRGPTAFGLDTGLSKTFRIFERYSLEFRGEAFNLFNHPSFGLPSSGIASSGNQGLAQISTTTSVPRVLQFALKLHF